MALTLSALFVRADGNTTVLNSNHPVKKDDVYVSGNPLNMVTTVLDYVERRKGARCTTEYPPVGYDVIDGDEDYGVTIIPAYRRRYYSETTINIPSVRTHHFLPTSGDMSEILRGLDIGRHAIRWLRECKRMKFDDTQFKLIVGESIEGIEAYFSNKEVTIPPTFLDGDSSVTQIGLKVSELTGFYQLEAIPDKSIFVVVTKGFFSVTEINVVLCHGVDGGVDAALPYVKTMADHIIGSRWGVKRVNISTPSRNHHGYYP